jgi:acetoin utilization deacetylase AcuC-like enzyme
MGFCFFNNIAVAAAHALAAHKLSRVAVIDFDVHHGNGTEDCFRADQRVLMVSTFQHPFYPYSGTEKPGVQHAQRAARQGRRRRGIPPCGERSLDAASARVQPEMLFISAGFDAHYEDEMGGLRLLEKDYAWVTGQLKLIADESAQGRIVSMLEGGYSLSALARSVAAHLRVLAEL